jgi:hypothetical protein
MREGRRGPSDLDRAVVRDECRASRRFRRVLVKGGGVRARFGFGEGEMCGVDSGRASPCGVRVRVRCAGNHPVFLISNFFFAQSFLS